MATARSLSESDATDETGIPTAALDNLHLRAASENRKHDIVHESGHRGGKRRLGSRSSCAEIVCPEDGMWRSLRKNGRFVIPWKHSKTITVGAALKYYLFSKDNSKIPSKQVWYRFVWLYNIPLSSFIKALYHTFPPARIATKKKKHPLTAHSAR